MKFLFFFVHPSKFHAFRNTINILIENGNEVEILITSKDVLEDLVKLENWNYKNIFPKGRKIKGLSPYLSAAINAFRTIYRIEKFIYKKKYDLFITDDLLVINGRLHNVPSILFQDDDVTAVPESILLLRFADYILTPFVSDMGKYNNKKLPFHGYKELGSLHPKRFIPNIEIIRTFNPKLEKYFIIRLVSLRATHDVGKSGLNNADVQEIINLLEKHGKVFITSERKLPEQFEDYRIKINPIYISQVLYHAEFLIGDSQTMSAEAGVLGTPYIRYNDFVGRISYLEELENKYQLGTGIKTGDKEILFDTIKDYLETPSLKMIYQSRKERMLTEKIDMTDFLVWLFESYPKSKEVLKINPNYQLKFR